MGTLAVGLRESVNGPEVDGVGSLEELEASAERTLRADLALPTQLVMQTHHMLLHFCEKMGNQSEPAVVCQKLLLRASNDLRCVYLLASRGYPAQAGAVGTSALEAVVTGMYIGVDSERAKAWWAHTDRTESYVRFRKAIREIFSGDADGKVPQFFLHAYRELCVAKHGNPVHELGINTKDPNTLHFFNGPDSGPQALWSGFFAMHKTACGVCLGLEHLSALHLCAEEQQVVLQRLATLRPLLADLISEVKHRGWSAPESPL